jgi:integrase
VTACYPNTPGIQALTSQVPDLEGLRFHDLRREAISRLFEKGLTIAEVREISGHKTLSQLATYTRGDVERLPAKLDRPETLAA